MQLEQNDELLSSSTFLYLKCLLLMNHTNIVLFVSEISSRFYLLHSALSTGCFSLHFSALEATLPNLCQQKQFICSLNTFH